MSDASCCSGITPTLNGVQPILEQGRNWSALSMAGHHNFLHHSVRYHKGDRRHPLTELDSRDIHENESAEENQTLPHPRKDLSPSQRLRVTLFARRGIVVNNHISTFKVRETAFGPVASAVTVTVFVLVSSAMAL
jgi:hypothetical protein